MRALAGATAVQRPRSTGVVGEKAAAPGPASTAMQLGGFVQSKKHGTLAEKLS